MDFGLDELQTQLNDSVRSFLADKSGLNEVRRIAANNTGFDHTLWRGLSELGVVGLLVPEEFGGSGLGIFEAAIVAQAMGYYAAPVPFASAGAMAVRALVLGANKALQQEVLPRIARGELKVGISLAQLSGQTGQQRVELKDGRLSGRVEGALECVSADAFLIYLADGRAALVEAGADGVSCEVRRSVDRTRPLATITLSGVTAKLLDAAENPKRAARAVLNVGRVLLAADAVGAAQYMIHQALEYSMQRRQFGRIIGSFQGVKHALADAVTMLEPCEALVWHAAHAQDAIPEEAELLTAHAKAHVGDVTREVARIATEVYGGMGFTDLLGLHYWSKRCSHDRQLLGAPERCREDAATLQGWT